MRVISGKYKGKILKGIDIKGTRPTMDRVKEGMFGLIQDYIKDSIVLDLFAGSGSLGIEAISNGAKYCYMIDKEPLAIQTIKQNITNIENIEVLKMDYRKALTYFKDKKFDLIFLDPPYNLNIINEIIDLIKQNNLLNENGLIICETNYLLTRDNDLLFKHKKYGDKNIYIFKIAI